MTDIDQYALQRSLFGGTNTEIHNKAYREELHAREKDHIPNPNVNPGQYAPKGGRNPLLKVVQHANGWTASTMLPGGKEFRVEGNSHQEAVSNAIRAGEKLGHVFDPPKPEPEIGGLFHGGHFDEKQHPREQTNAGTKHAGQFAPKHQAEPAAEAPFILQRPKKNRAVATFDNNANTKQGGLFDAGKKGELPGQSLLFNSDAGDLHNPKTKENKVAAKPVSRDSFMAQRGAGNMGHSDPALHRLPGIKDNRKQQLIAGQANKAADWQTKRDEASSEYDEAVKNGDVREPTRIERLATASSGHLDNESTQAAIRLLSKQIADEQVKNNENIGITMERHGVTIKGHPNYRVIRKQVMDHVDAMRDKATKPQPSPARQRAMDAQAAKNEESGFNHDQHIKIAADSIDSLRKQDVYRLLESAPQEHRSSVARHIGKHRPEFLDEINESMDDLGEQSVKYSRRVYEQFEHETERYLRDYTLYDVDRYGMGGKLMRTILAFMAMHAMSGLIGKQPQGGAQKKPAQASTPSNQDFEKLHPRETVQGGNHKPGQFAKKHAGASPIASAQGQRRESTLSSTLHHDPKQIEREQQAADMKNHLAGLKSLQPHFKKKAADQARADKAAEREAARAAAKEAKENPDWLKQAQEAMVRQAAKPRTGAFADDAPPVPHSPSPPSAPSVPIQAPQDRHTAKVAEIWHGKPEQPAQPSTAPAISNTPTAESFTNEVLQHHAGQSESSPRNYPDNLNKPPEEQTNYAPPERSIHDVMRNPAWEKQKAEEQEPYSPGERSIHDIMRNPAWEKHKAKLESEKRTAFDPKEFGAGVPEQPDAPGKKLTVADTGGDYTAMDAANKERAKAVKANREWEKKVNENPDENIASVASEYEIDHEPFSQYVNQMQEYEQDQWKQREAVKTAIRKAWGVHGGTLRDMENKGMDHSSLASTDNLKGNLTDAQIYEHLGSDEGSWSQNAWDMLREDPQPKPGAHDREWLDRHAHEFLRMQANQHEDPAEYPEPEDGMPFSRRSLALSADRYFRELRKHDNQKGPQNWTILDQWI